MSEQMIAYYAGRERVERMWAEKASNAKVRGIHLELADRYARLARPRRKLSINFGSAPA